MFKATCFDSGVSSSGLLLKNLLYIVTFTVLYVLFWVIPRRLSSKTRGFGTLYRFHLQGLVDEETSAFRTQTPGNYPKENILDKTYTARPIPSHSSSPSP